MKYLVILTLSCLFSKIALGQNYPQAAKFIAEVVRRDNIVYEDSTFKGMIADMREALQVYKARVFYRVNPDSVIYTDNTGRQSIISVSEARRLSNVNHNVNTRDIRLDSLILSEKEMTYIYGELDKMLRHKWADNLLTNSKVIAADTVRLNAWVGLNKKGINIVYDFSVPIFIRDETFCFFCSDYGCGWLCGQGEFALYKKENGKWIKFRSLRSWQS